MTTSEDNSPPSLASAPEPDLDTNVDSNHSSVNDETVAPMDETSDNEPIVPPSEADSNSSNAATKETNSEQENASKEATEKTSSANTSNKPFPVSKPKASRDKNGGSVACGRVTSKSHVTGSESGGAGSGTSRKAALNSQAGMAGNYILEPDPKVNGTFHSTETFENLEIAANVACVASVSAQFRSKERGTRVKDRGKNGASKRALSFFGSYFIKIRPKPRIPFLGLSLLRNQTETLATQATANGEKFPEDPKTVEFPKCEPFKRKL